MSQGSSRMGRRRGVAPMILLAFAFGPAPGWAQDISLPLGTAAPPAALQTLDGEPVQLLDYVVEGKPTLLEFWAIWCGNCKILQPQLDQIQDRWGSRMNVVAVAVAVSQSPEQVKRHVEQEGIAYPYLWDGEGEAVKAYDIPGTSIVVILDDEGRVAYTGTGREQDLVGTVEEILSRGR